MNKNQITENLRHTFRKYDTPTNLISLEILDFKFQTNTTEGEEEDMK